MINFNVPPIVGTEIDYIRQAIENHKICGDGAFTKQCSKWIIDEIKERQQILKKIQEQPRHCWRHPVHMLQRWQQSFWILNQGMR